LHPFLAIKTRKKLTYSTQVLAQKSLIYKDRFQANILIKPLLGESKMTDKFFFIISILSKHRLFYDKIRNAAFISCHESGKKNNNHFYEIGSSMAEQFIKMTIDKFLGILISKSIMKDVCDRLTFNCMHADEFKRIHRRIAFEESNGCIYIDVDNKNIRKIGPSKHRIVSTSKAKFIKNNNILPMAEPDTENSDVELLHKYIHVPNDEFKVLLVAILNSFFDNTPHVLIAITGEGGAAKSTIQTFLKMIMDPSSAALNPIFESNKDLVSAALNSHVIDINNVSKIKDNMQDLMCVILTGGTHTSRALYTNNEQSAAYLHNPIIMNGIGDSADRDDLLQRTVYVPLKEIGKEVRKTEGHVMATFDKDLPVIMAGLFDTLSDILHIQESFETDENLNRMADFHKLGLMTEESLGWEEGSFTKAYNKNIALSSVIVIEGSKLAQAILRMRGSYFMPFQGSYQDLLERLSLYGGSGNLGNITAKQLAEDLVRIAPSLAKLYNLKITKLGRKASGFFILIEDLDNPMEEDDGY